VHLCVDNKVFHEDQYVAVGQQVTIDCHASDLSKPVLWDYKRSEEQNVRNVYDKVLINDYERRCTIGHSSYDLTILRVELNDTGVYYCTEKRGFGTKHITKLYVTGIVQEYF